MFIFMFNVICFNSYNCVNLLMFLARDALCPGQYNCRCRCSLKLTKIGTFLPGNVLTCSRKWVWRRYEFFYVYSKLIYFFLIYASDFTFSINILLELKVFNLKFVKHILNPHISADAFILFEAYRNCDWKLLADLVW